jgi:hypothetical protein
MSPFELSNHELHAHRLRTRRRRTGALTPRAPSRAHAEMTVEAELILRGEDGLEGIP